MVFGVVIGALIGKLFSIVMRFSRQRGFIDRESYVAQVGLVNSVLARMLMAPSTLHSRWLRLDLPTCWEVTTSSRLLLLALQCHGTATSMIRPKTWSLVPLSTWLVDYRGFLRQS